MTPTTALAAWAICLAGLLYFDPAKRTRTSLALWMPVAWMFFIGSRLPSQWFDGQVVGLESVALQEGNALDRGVFLVLIVTAVAILASRSFSWRDFVQNNLALTTFIAFALLSILWSDFPFVSFKRWFRDLGSYLAILVVLSDAEPLEAVRTTLRRLSYLLIPLSILLIKYFPLLGRQYSEWTGEAMYVGPATSKNSLGVVCLVSGLFFFWDTLVRWSDRSERRTKVIIAINIAFIAMTIWLLYLSHSATSRVCLILGCLVIAVARSQVFQRRPFVLNVVVPALLCLFPILVFGFNMNAELAGVVGRDGTFTDRTEIWEMVTSMQTNPLVGTGYESFWLGDRLNTIWQSKIGGINEAHDGYLEVYLNLGIIGLALLMVFLIGSYRAICRQLATDSFFPSLALAIWIVAVIYNITESAFKSHFMWVVLLLAAIHLSTGVHEAVGESEESELPGEPEEELVAPGAWSTGTA